MTQEEEVEEVKFLKTLLQEKEQTILDLEKKVRLIEFRTKKQVQEITLQMESERIKLNDIEGKYALQSEQLSELRGKSIQQDQVIDQVVEQDSNAKDYLILQEKIEQLTACELKVKLLQDQGELQQQQANDMMQRELESCRVNAEAQQQQLIETIKELSEQNDILKCNSSVEFQDMQEHLKDQYMQKVLNQENDYGRRETLMLQQLQQFEDKMRLQEEVINESSSRTQHLLDDQIKIHAREQQAKTKEIQEYKDRLLQDTKLNQDNLARVSQDMKTNSEMQMKQLVSDMEECRLNLDNMNKKFTKSEMEKERRETQIQEYKQSDRVLKVEVQSKLDQINNLVDTYEAKIQDMLILSKSDKKKHDQQMQGQRETYESRLKELEQDTSQNLTSEGYPRSSISGPSPMMSEAVHLHQMQELGDLRDDLEKQKIKVKDLKMELLRATSTSTQSVSAHIEELRLEILSLNQREEVSIKERLYAEEVATRESLKCAQMAMEYEIALKDARKYYKMIQKMQQK